MTKALNIAAAQYPIERFETLAGYEDKLGRWVAEAAGAGADLLVFPEYGAMEYAGCAGSSAETLAGSLEAAARGLDHMIAVHSALAHQHKVHILAASGPAGRTDGKFVNRARLFAPSGAHAAQDKMIMTPFERNWGIEPGSELCLFETSIGSIGVAICYDSEFPLLVHGLAHAGADIVLIPSCTEFVSGFNRVRTAALARALENTIVTVQSPTVGNAPWSPAVDANSGAAGIFVPAERGLSDNGVIADGTLNAPGWLHATVALGHLRRVRETGEMRNVADWPLQPGAEQGSPPTVQRVMLR